MKGFGWTNPILVGADNDVIAGHARLLAARQLGLEEVPINPHGAKRDGHSRTEDGSD